MLDKIKEHLLAYSIICLSMMAGLFVGFATIENQKQLKIENGKKVIVDNCEFIKFYQGNDNFQYLHNPKCPNHND